ncbi:Tetratricopeptide repeat family protein [uncultured Gammaproteobacteria bacterium]|jgi:TPR repeat protein|nr:Tetratricopeptide repeat family protein [Bathymodiolus brooksi thiotrophic gill symbiont]CAC9547954.1 Tetratricopeptide repeat family protein [uncultured Gammaproteobacteria bacterium]CAB9543767.1 Tetratricopeptide repeat family protein [Bathymodiolus brooksi thiotrophic gill symbiont]CAC9551609.1 Tetratricopeptide repeat family protein [uncultured Gammaproteobacteria bacterium]CAC9557101.1 Tetratricopeptide repeat family protein [uncultured Gammaproteobacteria bacterium]
MLNSNETDAFSADLTSGVAAFDSKNFSMAYQLLAPLAAQGSAESLWRLGMMQMNGLGMVENQPLGFENFMKAAEQEHAFAHHMIAVAYMTGEGVEKDIIKAIEWFEKAAEYGLQGAMYALGMLYEDGKEVEKNLEKTQYWYDLAAKADDS